MAARSEEHERRILESHGLFGRLDREEIDRILAFARIETFRARQVIFRKGAPGRGLMAVLAGQVQIRSPGGDGRDAIINTIEEGEVFGEMALLDGGPRTATVTATTPVKIYVLSEWAFRGILADQPSIAMRTLEAMAGRMREAATSPS